MKAEHAGNITTRAAWEQPGMLPCFLQAGETTMMRRRRKSSQHLAQGSGFVDASRAVTCDRKEARQSGAAKCQTAAEAEPGFMFEQQKRLETMTDETNGGKTRINTDGKKAQMNQNRPNPVRLQQP